MKTAPTTMNELPKPDPIATLASLGQVPSPAELRAAAAYLSEWMDSGHTHDSDVPPGADCPNVRTLRLMADSFDCAAHWAATDGPSNAVSTALMDGVRTIWNRPDTREAYLSGRFGVTASRSDPDRLYCVSECGGYSCLGFDVCAERTERYFAWIMAQKSDKARRATAELPALPGNAPAKGTIAAYVYYRALTSVIFKIHAATGVKCDAELTPQLVGLEGHRVEVVDCHGERRRFIVGKSSGWIPIHLELAKVNSSGGGGVTGTPYKSVRDLGNVRG